MREGEDALEITVLRWWETVDDRLLDVFRVHLHIRHLVGDEGVPWRGHSREMVVLEDHPPTLEDGHILCHLVTGALVDRHSRRRWIAVDARLWLGDRVQIVSALT